MGFQIIFDQINLKTTVATCNWCPGQATYCKASLAGQTSLPRRVTLARETIVGHGNRRQGLNHLGSGWADKQLAKLLKLKTINT